MTKTAKQVWALCAGLMILLTYSAISEAGDAGDCFIDCIEASGCSSLSSGHDSAFCGDTETTCSARCSQSRDTSYGAIAYSVKNGAYGFSDSRKDRWQAEDAAMHYCSEHGKGCKKMVWFYNGCGAVASDGKKADWGQAPLVQEAAQQALDKCSKGLFFKRHCEVKVSHCSR